MKEFDWTQDIDSISVDNPKLLKDGFKYNPILTDEIFNEVRSLVTRIWSTPSIIGSDDTFGYVTEKLNRVNSLDKSWTSVIQMIRMFHFLIQRDVIFEHLSRETNEAIKLEMYDRGWAPKNF